MEHLVGKVKVRIPEGEELAEMSRQLFSYDPETGSLIRKIDAGRQPQARAGADVSKNVTYNVTIRGHQYKIHRIIMLMVGEIDIAGHFVRHINGDDSDFRYNNLEVIKEREFHDTRYDDSVPKSGQRGIYYSGSDGLWYVRTMKNKVLYNGSYFKRVEDAVASRDSLFKRLGKPIPKARPNVE